ncbi:phosphate-repressible phosphate permease [Gorgonomyces haynaldii]|nr:phosphate-repressible phosphate permease [Gorgonomyces haynaldii]
MEPYSYQFILILGAIFAFLDAYGIGANDVANSFATSVGSRSLTLWQACTIAIFTEFGGAVLLGAETTDTIKNSIIKVDLFKGQPEILMLGFMCALVGSSFWVIMSSKWGFPVSTTHSIVGAICGIGLAQFGWDSLDKPTLTNIVISWFSSPGIAGVVAAIIYLVTKYTVMNHSNSLERGLIAIPFYFWFTLTLMLFYVILKAPKGIDISKAKNQTPDQIGLALGLTFGLGVFIAILTRVLLVPYFRRLLVDEEDLKWYHVFYTPFVPKQPKSTTLNQKLALGADHSGIYEDEKVTKDDTPPSKLQQAYEYVTRGLFMDVASAQSEHVKGVHEKAVKYENKTEYLYSFLQVCTAAFASFAHGSNDVANAAGPFSGIVRIYETGQLPGKSVPVPFWLLASMGLAIDAGLILYGFNIMRVLGNNITYHSPSRGFSMELGAALTVITASFLGLPVSTTHCITGATVGVGLCNGELRAINWRVVAWCLFSWIVTLPVAGGIAGGLFLLITRSPR